MTATTQLTPSLEETIEYLRQTVYADVLADEFRARREVALVELRRATDPNEVFKAVGRIDALDDLLSVMTGK